MSKLKKALAGLMAVCMLMSTLTPAMAYSADVSMAEETNPVVAGDAVLADEGPSTPDDIEEPGEPTPTEAPQDGTEDDASKGDDVPSEPERTPEPSATPDGQVFLRGDEAPTGIDPATGTSYTGQNGVQVNGTLTLTEGSVLAAYGAGGMPPPPTAAAPSS